MKLSVNLFMTLDGVNQAPGSADEDRRGNFREGGWLMPYFEEGCGKEVDRWFSHNGEFLLGRNTFDTFALYWSKVTDEDNNVAQLLRDRHKHVVTSRPLGEIWRDTSKILSKDFLDDIRLIKKQDDEGELQVHGSIQLARELHGAGMIDIYRFLIAPVVVGEGSGIFYGNGPASSMTVTHHRVTDSGVIAIDMIPGDFVNNVRPAVRDGKETLEERP